MGKQQLDSGWRKASRSGTNGNCVETASISGAVLVRDTANRDGGTLEFSADAWQAFTGSIKG
jgi:hypothetical protein